MGIKTLTQVRADLRIDLKDSGALWSNAELDRCVELAYADLSRYLPREKFYEESLQFSITDETFTTPIDTDIDRIVDNESLTGKVSGNSCTVDGQPDVPRPITAIITDGSDTITGLVITISGFDKDNLAVSEVLAYAKGQSKSLVGSQYFKYISSVVLTQVGGVTTSTTLEMGIGAYTTVWVSLANRSIKYNSETTSVGTKDTDYYIDYVNGRIKVISTTFAANTAYTISYDRSHINIDLLSIPGFIRQSRVEYPVGEVPQSMVQVDVFGSLLTITGMGEAEAQSDMAEDNHIRVYYDATHSPPTDYVPGTVQNHLESSTGMLAEAYALLIYALNCEHQAVTDIAAVRTALGNIAAVHTLAKAALALADTQFDASVVAGLFTKVDVALDAIATKIGLVDTYLTGASAPSVKNYLGDGDAFLNTVNVGGEGSVVSDSYATFAARTAELAQTLLAESNAYTNEANMRMAESDKWVAAGRAWVEQASAYIYEIDRYITEAAQYADASSADMLLADRLRADALERRNEVLAIWQDRAQSIGNYTMGSVRQLPMG